MSDEWQTLTLRQAGVTLIDCDHRTPPPAENGYPYVAIPQLRNGRIDLTTARKITPEHFFQWTRKARPAANDVVLSRRCNPGETAFVPQGLEFALGQNLVLLRSDGDRIYPPFLRWLVRGPEWWEQIGKFLNVGAVFDSLRCADVPNFELRIPPIPQQRAIDQILGTLDNKIELNRRMNETLETMGRELFRSWFVDFEPVHAKIEGRDFCLPDDIGHLFPRSFEESQVCTLPKDWSTRSVYDCAEYINGLAFRDKEFSPDRSGFPIIKIGELKNGITAQTRFTNAERDPKYKVKSGDVLFSWSGSPDTSIDTFIWVGREGWLNQHIFAVHFCRPIEKLFVYFLLRHFRATFIEIARNKQTTGLGHVTAQDLKRLRTAFPPDDVLGVFNRIAQPLFIRAYNSQCEAQTLSALRDTLLPKLVSGELRVKQAEALFERV